MLEIVKLHISGVSFCWRPLYLFKCLSITNILNNSFSINQTAATYPSGVAEVNRFLSKIQHSRATEALEDQRWQKADFMEKPHRMLFHDARARFTDGSMLKVSGLISWVEFYQPAKTHSPWVKSIDLLPLIPMTWTCPRRQRSGTFTWSYRLSEAQSNVCMPRHFGNPAKRQWTLTGEGNPDGAQL